MSEEKVLIKDKGSVRLILLNRPRKKNAVDIEMYSMIGKAIATADSDINIKVIVLSGTGSMFSSGNDLNNFGTALSSGQSLDQVAEQGRIMLQDFVRTIVLCSKILIAAVNGDGVGIMFTLLPLFDLVFCVHGAKFNAPFSRLGQTPEGCSTFTFPRIFGTSRATEILMLGDKVGVDEAKDQGIISQVLEPENLLQYALKVAENLTMLQQTSILETKRLTGWDKQTLLKVNDEECRVLKERWQSPECLEAVTKFLTEKINSKL
ncbi:enoyl-CoA delta isomerase 2, mitochondrial [Eurytemora carolleeae]|uniref:enoyl-CoA delta isomerase 2, mitochondrial n=1 Tax=Eurytemora carolleeae TaxID=1294199 RepID=UPI000C767D32|nr:enoyl-CoA delta isomerase 2, mitochondrial [Eurytemora carolleeae]|eukprot:XP_023329950.1 enoyl-CoA delta isomerase 2, mitochondrial-like [Eurytemora affinis]